jgi:hypothetical protein
LRKVVDGNIWKGERKIQRKGNKVSFINCYFFKFSGSLDKWYMVVHIEEPGSICNIMPEKSEGKHTGETYV